ncbi:MAG: acyl carrier protein [Gemmatimonadales bacterium]
MSDQGRVAARVGELVTQVLGLPPDGVGPGLSASTSAAWTSLNHLMLISQLESEFGVVFSNQEVRELTSYSAIVAALTQRASGA